MNRNLFFFAAAWIASMCSAAFAADPCRPTAYLDSFYEITSAFQQPGANARLEATLARDIAVSASLSSLGLEKGGGVQELQRTSGVLSYLLDYRDLAEQRGRLRFDGDRQGRTLVQTTEGRTLLLYFVEGEPLSADGVRLDVVPTLGRETKFVALKGSRVRLEGGKPQLLAGSVIAFGRPVGEHFAFRLMAPARFDMTSASISPQRLDVIRPIRAAKAGKITLTVGGAHGDFGSRRLTFCFDVAGAGHASAAVLAQDVKLVSQTGDIARFEVRVPDVDGLRKSEAARKHLSSWIPSVGLPSTIRVLGYDSKSDNVILDATGSVTLSDGRIAVGIGIVMLSLLFVASAVWLHRLSPFAIVGALVRGNSGRYSLSNLQVLMWTALVIFAMTFNWATTGELLDISEGILVLLGIAGGASVLTRVLAVQKPQSGQLAPSNESVARQLFGSEESGFDLLRFQMLGFTLFTWCYALGEVLRNQGLPEIPQSLYWLMGISNTAYLGGKVPGVMARSGAADGEALSETERQIPEAEIRAMQAALRIHASGIVDAATREAVRSFKQAQGIVPVNGFVDRLLIDKIKSIAG